jgi:hypothetical protein
MLPFTISGVVPSAAHYGKIPQGRVVVAAAYRGVFIPRRVPAPGAEARGVAEVEVLPELFIQLHWFQIRKNTPAHQGESECDESLSRHLSC